MKPSGLTASLALAASVLLGACASDTSTAPGEAAANPGSTRTVCARVADVVEDPVSDGPLHLYLERPSPDQSLIVTIRDRATAGNQRYLARNICVTGQVLQSPDGPRIVVDRAPQVTVSSEPVPVYDVSEVLSRVGDSVRICGPLLSYEATPGSDLAASLVLGTGDPSSSLWVEVSDRRRLDIGGEVVGRRACVTGFVRPAEAGRAFILLRDPRELTLEG